MSTRESLITRNFGVLTGLVLITWLILPLIPLAIWSFAKGWFFPDLLPKDVVAESLGIRNVGHGRRGGQFVADDRHIPRGDSSFDPGGSGRRAGRWVCINSGARKLSN